MKINSNLISAISLFISVSAIYLVYNRDDFSGWEIEDTISISLALISICTTLMVASQIQGLRYSKKEIFNSIKKETDKLQYNWQKKHFKMLYRIEMTIIANCAERELWKDFANEVTLLVDYVSEIKEKERADHLSNFLILVEDSSRFMQKLDPDTKQVIKKKIWELCLYSTKKIELIKKFHLVV